MVRVARPLLSTNASNVLPRPPPALNYANVVVKSEYPVGVDIIPEHNPSGIPMANSGHAGPSSSPNASQSQQPDKKPPRPPNAWIIYRSDKLKELGKPKPGQPKVPQAEISKSISLMWRNETDAVKKKYERMAEYAKAEHARMYPNYRFAPMKKADKERLRKEEKEAKAKERAAEKRAKQRPGPYYIPVLHGAGKAEEEEDDGLMPTVLDPMAYSPPISCANTPEPVHDDLPSPADEPSPASIGDEHVLRLPSSSYKGKEPEQPLLMEPVQQWQAEDPVAPDANFEGPASWTAHGLLPDGPGNLDFGPMDMSGWDPEFLQSLNSLQPTEGMPNFDQPPEHLDIDFSLFPGSTEAQNTEPSQQQLNGAENFLQPFNLDMFDMDGPPVFPSLLDDPQQWNMAPAPTGDQQQWPGPLDAQGFGGSHDSQSYPQSHDQQQYAPAQPQQHPTPQDGTQQGYPGAEDAAQQQQQQQQSSRQSSGDMMQYLHFDGTTDAGSRHSSGSASVPQFAPTQTEGERQRMSSVATITTERYHRFVSGGSEVPSPSSYYAPSPASRYSHEPSPVPASSSYAPSPASPYPPSAFPTAGYSHQPSPASYSHQPSPAAYSPVQYGQPHIHRSVSGSSIASTTSTHSQQQALQPTQPQPYVPPAGAGKVGSRRVGGRWAYPTQ